MRKSLLFVWACMGLVCLMSACKTSVKSKEWKLVWVEDFDQKNSFDESVWTKIPRGTSDWNDHVNSDQITPWVEAFVNARKWVEANKK